MRIAAFRLAFGCLAAGLGVWLIRAGSPAPQILTAGLLGLLLMPVLKLVAVILAAGRERDWLTLGATVVVTIILFAFTFRDAAALR